MFVVGGTLGLVVCAEREGTWFLDFKTEPPPRDDVMSVDWLDRSTFISGDRSGKVRLYDTRHKGTSLRIVSPSSATHVKRMYEHSIVVAGNRASNVCFATYFNSHTVFSSSRSFNFVNQPDLPSM